MLNHDTIILVCGCEGVPQRGDTQKKTPSKRCSIRRKAKKINVLFPETSQYFSGSVGGV